MTKARERSAEHRQPRQHTFPLYNRSRHTIPQPPNPNLPSKAASNKSCCQKHYLRAVASSRICPPLCILFPIIGFLCPPHLQPGDLCGAAIHRKQQRRRRRGRSLCRRWRRQPPAAGSCKTPRMSEAERGHGSRGTTDAAPETNGELHLTKKKRECASPCPIPWLRASSLWSASTSCGALMPLARSSNATTIRLHRRGGVNYTPCEQQAQVGGRGRRAPAAPSWGCRSHLCNQCTKRRSPS